MTRFAHISDVHLGGWKQEPLQELNFQSFRKIVDTCIKEKVDFIIYEGEKENRPSTIIDLSKDNIRISER